MAGKRRYCIAGAFRGENCFFERKMGIMSSRNPPLVRTGGPTSLAVILNIFLIPRLGVAGAATASVISIVLMNVIRSAKLYLLCRVQPLSKNLFKPAVVWVILAFLIEAVAQNFLTITWWVLLLLFILYCGIYGLATLFTRSFDEEDIAMLLEIESRSGINAAPVKRILGRFL